MKYNRKPKIKLIKEGNENEDDIINAEAKYRATSHEYAEFSKTMGLPQQRQRVNVDNLYTIGKFPKEKVLKNAVGHDIILVNKSYVRFAPNTITQVVNKKSGITRNYYGETGRQIKQISNNDHGHKKESKFGQHGEHAHDYYYDNIKKSIIHDKSRELNDIEKKENADIL